MQSDGNYEVNKEEKVLSSELILQIMSTVNSQLEQQ